MVGGLIQNKQTGSLQQQLGDRKPGLLSAGELIHTFIKAVLGKAHAGKHRFYFNFDLIAVPRKKSVLGAAVLLGLSPAAICP